MKVKDREGKIKGNWLEMKGSRIELDKSTTKTPLKEARGRRDGFWKIVCTGSHFSGDGFQEVESGQVSVGGASMIEYLQADRHC